MIRCTILLILAIGALCDTHVLEKSGEGTRHKRLLFYDEDGNLVKTYKNPYLQDLALNAEKFPFYGNFINPFFAFIHAYGGSLAAFAIPVSSEVVEQIQNDPIYQHRLVLTPKKDPVIAPNAVCEGKRAQIPSKNCNNFLNCWDGWAFEQECPQGLLFSREGYCDYSHNVDCSNREILHKPDPMPQPVLQPAIPQLPALIQPQPPSQPQPQPPVLPPSQPHPQPPVQTQPPQAPSQPQPQPPSPPLPQPPQPCQHPQPNPPQPQPAPPLPQPSPPQPQPSPQPQPVYPQRLCSQDFESFINQYNCNEFFVCVNRQPVKFQCPADLAYSELYGVCDYPDRVGCIAATAPTSARKPILPLTPGLISTKPAFISPELFVNYQSHLSDPNTAMSRQDAIRQLQAIK